MVFLSKRTLIFLLVGTVGMLLTYFLMRFWYTTLYDPCDKLKDENEKAECKKIATVCESETGFARDICYRSLAETTRIVEFCEKTRNSDTCRENIILLFCRPSEGELKVSLVSKYCANETTAVIAILNKEDDPINLKELHVVRCSLKDYLIVSEPTEFTTDKLRIEPEKIGTLYIHCPGECIFGIETISVKVSCPY